MINNIVLIADHQEINRRTLIHILCNDYDLLEADNGEKALQLMRQYRQQLAAVILDLSVSGQSDGQKIVREWKEDKSIGTIPVIAAVEAGDEQGGILQTGVWEIVQRPYVPDVVRFRVKNVIERSELRKLKQVKNIC